MNCNREPRLQGSATRLALVLAAGVVLACGPSHAQQDQSATTPTAVQDGSVRTRPGQPDSTSVASYGSETNPSTSQGSDTPNAVNLETGLPLRTVMTPVHWGHFSLFSASLTGIYDSNFLQSMTPEAAQSTFLNTLVVYSLRRRRTQFDLQYMPTVWAANGQVHNDFANHAVDGFTSRALSRRWAVDLHDNFRYSPQQFGWTTPSFAPDFISNTAQSNAFLLADQKMLMNNFNATLNGELGERSRISVGYTETFIRLSPLSDNNSNSIYGVTSEENISAFTANWNRNLTRRNSVSVNYQFESMYEHYSGLRTHFQNVLLGYTRTLRPTLTLSLQAGPGWSSYHGGVGSSPRTRTAEGSFSLFKSFREGGIALSFTRSNNFVGVISNAYNNRYDVSVAHKLARRWRTQVGYSYVQQELTNSKRLNSGLANVSLDYSLTRNWSLFSSYHYFTYTGAQFPYSRRSVMGAGIRWAWTPRSRR